MLVLGQRPLFFTMYAIHRMLSVFMSWQLAGGQKNRKSKKERQRRRQTEDQPEAEAPAFYNLIEGVTSLLPYAVGHTDLPWHNEAGGKGEDTVGRRGRGGHVRGWLPQIVERGALVSQHE